MENIDPENIANLIRDLWSQDKAVRQQSIESLGKLGDAALDQLMKALEKDDRNSELRDFENMDLRRAIMSVGEPAFQKLINLLQTDLNMARAAAKTLEFWDDSRAVEPLIKYMDDESNQNGLGKCYAIDALGHFKDPRSIPILIKMLDDKDEYVQSHSARALAEFGDPTVLTKILSIFNRKQWTQVLGLQEGLPQILKVLQKTSKGNGREKEFEKVYAAVKTQYPDIIEDTENWQRKLVKPREK